MEKSEQEQFLEDLEIKPEDILEKPLEIESTEETPKEESTEDTEQKAKNRRERRLLEKNQQLREEAIAASARLQALSEVTQKTEGEADYLKLAEQIYGTDAPEKILATDLLKKVAKGAEEAAYNRALEEFERRRQEETESVKKEEGRIDEMLEKIEDDHNVDFSDENERKGFLNLLEKLSPKDREGNIIEYADADSVYELYEANKSKSNSRAKELASKSMTRSGQSGESKLNEDSTMRFLRENGLIF